MSSSKKQPDSSQTNYLDALKERFKKDINSNRRLEEISTLEELIDVLEDRLILTDSLLSELEPSFQNLVISRRKDFRESSNKRSLADILGLGFVTQNHEKYFREFGLYLGLPEYSLGDCEDIEDVINLYQVAVGDVSLDELAYWIRNFEKEFVKEE